MNDVKSLSHSKWRCKYHIVFAPKYRRQIIYGRIKADVGKILRDLCNRKNVEIIDVNVNIRMYNFDDVQCTVIPSVAYGFVTGMNLQLC